MSGETMDSRKAEARKRFREMRAGIQSSNRKCIDASIAACVLQTREYQNASIILPYLSFGAEVDTHAIIEDAWATGKRVALPRCIEGTRNMTWHRVDSFAGLTTSRLGVDEPPYDDNSIVDPIYLQNALAIIPGLTFDDHGYRLGYGGGFYDVFLSDFKGTTMGLCRNAQLSERLDIIDEFDLPVRIVVTEDRVIRCR